MFVASGFTCVSSLKLLISLKLGTLTCFLNDFFKEHLDVHIFCHSLKKCSVGNDLTKIIRRSNTKSVLSCFIKHLLIKQNQQIMRLLFNY